MEKLLNMLNEGRALSQNELADELGISAETLAAQIDYMERLGILRRIESACGCSGGCGGCSSKCHDGGISPPVMWERAR